ncbi:Sugar kinase of the NBD/HSP70 family, may contain an N-terminal HTH domain [Thermomonospora echinospora]|uniref:Sugar kinase of the NBD/HSP70 family, may contain an N-terminal HTH domain n=1 Tax=Thermomonospora echinospora TaxID=1992 RepID=A0A1H6BKS0_9ACTN|nr:ROK family transcriptional regulator [Thermomonospora echinospora]SEG61309.1 Sugar kinase of the NBD/HSP70 family, may contain an N-terminal HTH domain [Thermomonospora echinospora]
MANRPGTPRLLRELNDRAALELLIDQGPLTRAQIGRHTGLSKVTASQLLARLEERGLVEVVGEQAGGRGPNAALYAVVPASAYVAGLEVGPHGVTAGIADITGRLIAQVTGDPNGADDPVKVVHNAVVKACRSARVALGRLNAFVIGTPGVVDPRSGDVQFVFDLPAWHEGVLAGLRTDLRRPVVLENDVNLAALAERAYGAARDAEDFALMWCDRGIGLSVMLGGRLHRGVSGGAGEIGYLPVPGVPLPDAVTESISWGTPALAGGLGSLVGADAVLALARSHGLTGATAVECVREAAADIARGGSFLDELAVRISYGVASVNIVLDPGLVVLSGQLGRAGGAPLAERIEQAVGRICPTRPRVAVTEVEGNPVLRGALHAALEQAREEVFSATAD